MVHGRRAHCAGEIAVKRNVLRYLGVAVAFTGSPACAAGTHFGFKQIVIDGSTNVEACALNNTSAIAGVYTGGAGSHGFILAGSTLTVLPPTYSNGDNHSVAGFPTSINAGGDEGAMLVSDDSLSEGSAQTWRVLCGGQGC